MKAQRDTFDLLSASEAEVGRLRDALYAIEEFTNGYGDVAGIVHRMAWKSRQTAPAADPQPRGEGDAMITRYTEICTGNDEFTLLESETGEYVMYADVAQLEADLATAREQLARINYALALSLPQIEDWTHAYPKESFPEPNMDDVRRMLGDSVLSVVSADAMRHVITRVWELLEPVRTAQVIDSGLKL